LKRLDYLILKELASPWTFGVGLFTAILLAAGPLNKITSFLAGGASPALVGKLVLLFMPALLVKTFSMSILLAGLLGFGRLSSDSEIVAMQAGGASIPRIIAPVIGLSLLISAVTFWFNDSIVPQAARTAVSLAEQLAKEGKIGGTAYSKPQFSKGKLTMMINARNVDLGTQTMQGVSIILYDKNEKETTVLLAPRAQYKGPSDWRILDELKIIPLSDPRAVTILHGGAWPVGVPQINKSLADLFVKDDDYDSYTIAELRTKIAQMKVDQDKKITDIRDFEYGYFNKFSVALAALVFGTLGSVLGIRNHRTGTASGFALAVGIIFGYVLLANFMNVWARSGFLPPWAASFAPLCIGAVACGVIIYRRNA
jgi:lipopolysaccharide export system permease protein